MQQFLMLIHHIILRLVQQRKRFQHLLPAYLDKISHSSETIPIQSILPLHQDLLKLAERLRIVDKDIISEHSIRLLDVPGATCRIGQLHQFHNPPLI